MGQGAVLLVIMLCSHLLFVGIVQSTRNSSREEELNMQIHTKLLDTSSTNRNRRDKKAVVDSFIRPKCDFLKLRSWNQSFDSHLEEMQLSKPVIMETTNRPHTYFAIARTKVGPRRYSGASSHLKIDKPKVIGGQYSATRMKLQFGVDSIEAGWRVDPSLYGDSRTHYFIRTDLGTTHCYNNRCRGFVITFPGTNFDYAVANISIPGGQKYIEKFYIIKDNRSGNWNLMMGKNPDLIGHWPSHLFSDSTILANRVEWGGVAYSPPHTPLPPMGSSNQPVGDPSWDGYVTGIRVLDERGQPMVATDLETYANNPKLYSVIDCGYHLDFWGHVILYGGSGHQ